MSYPPPPGPWPPPGYGPPHYSYQPVPEQFEELQPPDNRSMIMLVALGLPLLLLCAFGAMFFVLTDEGRSATPSGETSETQVVDSPPDIQLDLSPPSDQPTAAQTP
ncbi:MAG: hypothetical protein HOV96_37600 [Nonomuraea sp.]|nr:hypothetical protein [Nonomuraea sp.]NUP60654.1 hypothetical protein [Nonomuraea sp.]NUP83261.1 hypothetical protein [Nonomuraea sp.]NUS06843.1 hypothetical protein [Nonomuraea sp.]NUT45656.1 hypothetical protein [Thermoactinospora sp.]